MTDHDVRRMIWAVQQPLHRNKIWTLDMRPASTEPHPERWKQPVRFVVGPTLVVIRLRLAMPEKHTKEALGQGLAMEQYLKQVTGQVQPVRLYVDGDLIVEAPLPPEQAWRPTYGQLACDAVRSLLLGVDMRKQLVTLDLSNLGSGMFVAGQPGSGKTNAMLLLAAQAAMRGWTVRIVDMKGGEDWRGISKEIATTNEEALAVIGQVREEVDARNRGERDKSQPILLVFDEVWQAEKQVQQALGKLIAVCRSADVRVLAGSQRCSGIDPAVSSLLVWRLVGLVADAQESARATTLEGRGAHKLQGKGDMILVKGGGQCERVQVAFAEPADVAGLMSQAFVRLVQERAVEHVLPPAPLARLPRTALELEGMLRDAAVAAGDGREVPTAWVIAKAVEWAIWNQKRPPFAMLHYWSSWRMGKRLSDARCRDVREWAARLAGLSRAS